MTEEKIKQLEPLLEQAEKFASTSLELLKLKSIQKGVSFGSILLGHVAGCIVFLLAIVFLSVSLSIWIGEYLGKNYLGFLVLGIFYVLLALILLILKKPLQRLIANSFIKQIFN